ncbi:MAG: hypothetical protein V3R99_02215 [Thermoguttaceae bacterium]
MKLTDVCIVSIALFSMGLLSGIATAASPDVESDAKARARAEEMDRILLTAPPFDPAGQRVARPMTFRTGRFTLGFSATGVPVSLKRLSDGRELLDQGSPSMGFYLRGFDDRITKLRNLAERPDGYYVVSNDTNTQRVVFAVEEKERYLTIRIKEFYGIPKRVHLELMLEMRVPRETVKSVALDYMTRDYGKGIAHWPWLWYRGPKVPKGGIAIYLRRDDDDEDDTFLRIWAAEGLPHPKVRGTWDYARAKRWIEDWKRKYADISGSGIQFPEREQDYYDILPYLKKAGTKIFHVYGRTYADRRHHCWVSDKFFEDGREGFRKLAERMNQEGIGISIHYDFCRIPFDDPIFIGGRPRRDLQSWGDGLLMKPIDENETTILFRPARGVELPYSTTGEGGSAGNPPVVGKNHQFNMFRIGNEIVRVGQFLNTEGDVWILSKCERAIGSTTAAAHAADEEMVGLVTMYNSSFLPGLGSELYDEMTSELADLANYCHIDRIVYDGLNPCNFANSNWSYRKWTGDTYAKLDHPVIYASGFGAERYFGHFEYRLHSVQKLGQRIMDLGTRIRTWHISRAASTLDEAHMRMSQAAALNLNDFQFGFACHYPSKNWRDHGMLGPIAETVGLWKEASRNMTQAQRDRIKATLHPPGHRGYHSDIVWKLRPEENVLKIYPTKNPLTRRSGDVMWGCTGSEMGYVTPGQYVRTGQVLELNNPYAAQPPHFSIRIITAMDYDNPRNIDLQPDPQQMENPTAAVLFGDSRALTITRDNRSNQPYSAKDQEVLMPLWHTDERLKLQQHRGMGLWVTGDGSGSLLLLRMPRHRDYVVRLDFEGRRYHEIPNGEAYWVGSDWGGPRRSISSAYNYETDWFKLGFGEIPTGHKATVKVEGLKALAETEVTLVNPVIHIGNGTMTIEGRIESHQQLRYTGGNTVGLYDRNWKKIKNLPIKLDNYTMRRGDEKVWLTADGPTTWAFVRFSTEDAPMIVPRREDPT